jgi:hypothetical protein
VNFLVDLPILHEGPANVSIVQTSTNRVIGEALIVFDTYADESLPQIPANNTNFDITMPKNLGANDCIIPGDCVLQWFWFGTHAVQTYESCIDFVMVPPGLNPGFGNGNFSSPVGNNSTASNPTPPSASQSPADSTGSGYDSTNDPAEAAAAAAAAVPAKADATPLAVQPDDVTGGVVGSISVQDAATKKRKRRALIA